MNRVSEAGGCFYQVLAERNSNGRREEKESDSNIHPLHFNGFVNSAKGAASCVNPKLSVPDRAAWAGNVTPKYSGHVGNEAQGIKP